MIIPFIGTKGQLIKMAPILQELEKRGYEYHFINASQHVQSLDKMINSFKVKKPNEIMWNFGKDVTNTKEILKWLSVNFLKYSIGSRRKSLKLKGKNIILVHGDAPPVFLGQALGLYHRIAVGHIEAGLRSKNYFSPFPEELIRIWSDRFSKLLFPLSNFAYGNIKDKYPKKIFHISRNTVYDSVQLAIKSNISPQEKNYVLVSIHRYETLQSKNKLKLVIDIINNVSKDYIIIFPIHESTKKALVRYDLYKNLITNDKIHLTTLMEYFTFINYLKNAQYMITDGGGPQEESYYLGTPCLILRESTERLIWGNICLGGFDLEKINGFLRKPEKYRIPPLNDNCSPSKEIVDVLEKLGYVY